MEMKKATILLRLIIMQLCFLALWVPVGLAEVTTLTIGNSTGYRGSHDNLVEISLANPTVKVRGLQFEICDMGNYLNNKGCDAINRAEGFLCETGPKGEDNCFTLILVSLEGDSIAEGSGPILTLTYDVSEEAPGGECRVLELSHVIIAGDTSPYQIEGEPIVHAGEFCFKNCTFPIECDLGLWGYYDRKCIDGACQSTEMSLDDGLYCPAKKLYKENSKETQWLRHFRDNVLSKTAEGQELIKLYYQWSPIIVRAMETDEEFKEDIKDLVDEILGMVE